MNIDYVRYLQEIPTVGGVLPRIEVKAGVEVWRQTWPSGTWRDDLINQYLNQGGSILTYDPYFGMSLDEARLNKKYEGELYGRLLVKNAYHTPYTNVVVEDTSIYYEKQRSKRRLRSDKVASSIPLSLEEQQELELASTLQSYEVECIDASSAFNDIVDTQTSVNNVAALDPVTAVVWPVWAPIVQ